MNMPLFIRSLSIPERNLLRELLRQETVIKSKIPLDISEIINAGNLREASIKLSKDQGLDLKVAWDMCIAFQQSLPLWEVTYTMNVDRDHSTLETPLKIKVEWYASNEDLIKRRFRDEWRMYNGEVFLNEIKEI